MDLVKVFTAGNKEWNITVKGAPKAPLFRASDIGAILGIGNIRTSIQNFVEGRHWVVQKLDTHGGQQNVKFLTEIGLYKLILRSENPFCEPFEEWVINVTKEIRLTGQYQLQRETEAKLIEFQQEKAAIEARASEAEAKADEERRLREEEQKRREELEDRMRSKKYEEVPKDEWVYIMKESAELHNNKHKIGKTINLPSRKCNFQTSHASKIEIVHQVATSNAHIVEQVVHSLLQRYHHGKEFYNCETMHSKNLIDFVGAVYDTLHGCYEFITREEIGQKLIEIVQAEMVKTQDVIPETAESKDAERHCETGAGTDKDHELGDFLDKHCELGVGYQVEQDAFIEAYGQILGKEDSVRQKASRSKRRCRSASELRITGTISSV